jgi:uncharacterized membrane protein YoaK (UPF0700 family)
VGVAARLRRGPVEDAWRTFAPEPGSRDGPLPAHLVGLTVVTGMVDAFSYLGLGHVFVANMTGNVVFVGFSLAGAPGFSLWASLAAIGAFSAGAVAGGRIGAGIATHRGRLLAASAAVESAIVLTAFIIAAVVGPPFAGGSRATLIVLLGVALGIQNATARRLAVPDLTTTVLTLTLTGISADSRIAGGRESKVGRRALSIVSMFLGGLIGAIVVRGSSPALALAIAAALLAFLAASAWARSRTSTGWSTPR